MLNRLELNQDAASRSNRQQLDHLLRVTTPHELVMLLTIGLMMLALLAWSLFGSIENGVTADCVLIKPGTRYDVVATEPGQLLEYLVAPGDHVEAGAPIARQSAPELTREIVALRDRVELLKRAIQRTSGTDGGLASLLTSAEVAVLELEALRSVRETIVAQDGGEVMALRSAPGSFLVAGSPIAQLRGSESDAQGQAVLATATNRTRLVQPGMRASVEMPAHGNDTLSLHGEVMSVTDGPLPHWLANFLPVGEVATRRIDLALESAPGLADGAACRARIILGRSSPIALLGPGEF